MRILVVEDDAKLVRALRRGLVQEGYDVDAASTGDTALEMAADQDYDGTFRFNGTAADEDVTAGVDRPRRRRQPGQLAGRAVHGPALDEAGRVVAELAGALHQEANPVLVAEPAR